MFGQQEAIFSNVELSPDVILVARFYLRRSLQQGFDMLDTGPHQDQRLHDDETLVAWTTMPMMILRDIYKAESGDLSDYRINTGTHILPLYEPPVPEPETIPLSGPRHCVRYNDASVRLHIFVDRPRPGSLTPSEASDEDEYDVPEFAWIPYSRPTPPADPYTSNDGYDVYIDGCLNLPDCVTFTRVAGRILNRKYEKVGRDVNTSVRLDSDIYNPVYDYRIEVREPNVPPTSTLLLKVYTIDKVRRKIMVAGYATLNVFVETGTEKQPISDTPGIQVSLNEGAHQLRLYQLGPNGDNPVSEDCLRVAGTRYVPCASLLVRIHKAVIGPQGRPLEADKVPQADWGRMGLVRPRPSYNSRVYQSLSCKPTSGESKLFRDLIRRTKVSLRESLHLVVHKNQLIGVKTDKQIEQYIRSYLTRLMDEEPLDIDLTFVAKYKPEAGLKFALDSAMNLPWSNFSHAHFCLNPPAAFYQGQPYAAYDKLNFTEALDTDSSNKCPAWKDGFKSFHSRSYQPYLCMIVHVQEIEIIVSSDSYKYGLLDQAWAPVPMFSDSYANTGVYQVPLIHGSPSTYMLKQLTQQPVKEWLDKNVSSGNVRLIEAASVFVRVADGRRAGELPADVPDASMVKVDTDLLPQKYQQTYRLEEEGRTMYSMVPQGKAPREFFTNLATKFKSLVYKLYEEGNFNER